MENPTELSDDYFDLTVELEDELIKSNYEMSEKYGDRYVNLLKSVQTSDKSVRVFTSNGKYISQDCRHLTNNGAEYIAQSIDWTMIFGGWNE